MWVQATFCMMPKKDREKKVKMICFCSAVSVVGIIWFARIFYYRYPPFPPPSLLLRLGRTVWWVDHH
jgi:hypothetical protein